MIEPYHGRILDPACGSGGMFVQSARFVSEHKKNPAAELSIHGVEKTDDTGRLCRLNLAVHCLEGDIRHGPRMMLVDPRLGAHQRGNAILEQSGKTPLVRRYVALDLAAA